MQFLKFHFINNGFYIVASNPLTPPNDTVRNYLNTHLVLLFLSSDGVFGGCTFQVDALFTHVFRLKQFQSRRVGEAYESAQPPSDSDRRPTPRPTLYYDYTIKVSQL